MDKKYILGSDKSIDYNELNQNPAFHIQRKKTPKLLDALTSGLSEERAKQFLKSGVKKIFEQRFTGRSDYDAVKRKIIRKIFLYHLIKLRTNKPQETSLSKDGDAINLTIAKF